MNRMNLTAAAVLFCAAGVAQPAPPLLYPAFRNSKAIVTGAIDAVDVGRQLVKLQITEQLRGKTLGPSVEVPYSSAPSNPRRPPLPWDQVRPIAGKHVLAFLNREEPALAGDRGARSRP